jgi:predicted membrane protein DUF2207
VDHRFRRRLKAVVLVVAGLAVAGMAAAAAESPPPDDPGLGLGPWEVAGIAGGAVLLAGAATIGVNRRRGRERVPAALAAASGRADLADLGGDLRMDHVALAELATPSPTPPRDLTPAQGGIVLVESVENNHLAAWLLTLADEGVVGLHGDGRGPDAPVRMVRVERGAGDAAAVLDVAFAGRDEVTLGSPDPAFAEAWRQLRTGLDGWRRSSGLWEPRRERPGLYGCGGCLLGVVGSVVAYVGALGVAREDGWLALTVGGGLVAGWALGLMLSHRELAVRTPQGSTAWLQVESFRRYLAAAEATDADTARRNGALGRHTAWAIALGQQPSWSRAVEAALADAPAGDGDDDAVRLAKLAPTLWRAVVLAGLTSTTPSTPVGIDADAGGGGGRS